MLLREALQTKVRVNKSGKVMTKREAIITQQVNKAAAGDRLAADFVLRALVEIGPNESLPRRSRGLSAETSDRIRAALTGQSWLDPRKKSS